MSNIPDSRSTSLTMWRQFAYLLFFTIGGDKLSIDIFNFTIRFNNLIAIVAAFIIIVSRPIKIGRKYFIFAVLTALSLFISYASYPSDILNLFYIFQGLITLTVYPFLLVYLSKILGTATLIIIYYRTSVLVAGYALLQFLLSLLKVYDIFSDQILPSGIVRAAAFTYEPSSLAIYLTFSICIGTHSFILSLVDNKPPPFKLPSLFVLYSGYLLTTSTTSYLSLLIFIIYEFLCFRKYLYSIFKKHYKSFLLPLFTLPVLITIIYAALPQSFSKIFALSDPLSNHSIGERYDMTINYLYAFKYRPFFGFGLGGVSDFLYNKYLVHDPNIYIFPTRYLNQNLLAKSTFMPMTIVAEILASLGLFGMSILATWLIMLSTSLKKMSAYFAVRKLMHWQIIQSLLISNIFLLLSMQLSQGLFRLYIIVPLILMSITTYSIKKDIPESSLL